jgi:hypothetical protein
MESEPEPKERKAFDPLAGERGKEGSGSKPAQSEFERAIKIEIDRQGKRSNRLKREGRLAKSGNEDE